MSCFLSSIRNTVATALALAITSGGCIAASLDEKPICEHSILDESAGVNFVAGLPVYISPKSFIKLTGCQTMWDSKGRISIQIVFIEGTAVQYVEYAETGIVELNCKYDTGVALPRSCPNRKKIATGFMVLSDEIEKSIPKFDDLRQREKKQN